MSSNIANVEYESLSFPNLRHALKLVEIAKQPRMENKSELLSEAAAAFQTLWLESHTLSSIDDGSLEPRVTHVKHLLNEKQDLILTMVETLPDAVRHVVCEHLPENLVMNSFIKDQGGNLHIVTAVVFLFVTLESTSWIMAWCWNNLLPRLHLRSPA